MKKLILILMILPLFVVGQNLSKFYKIRLTVGANPDSIELKVKETFDVIVYKKEITRRENETDEQWKRKQGFAFMRDYVFQLRDLLDVDFVIVTLKNIGGVENVFNNSVLTPQTDVPYWKTLRKPNHVIPLKRQYLTGFGFVSDSVFYELNDTYWYECCISPGGDWYSTDTWWLDSNDTLYPFKWDGGTATGVLGIDQRAFEVWPIEKGDTSVIVAFADDGLGYPNNHPDLGGVDTALSWNVAADRKPLESEIGDGIYHGVNIVSCLAATNNNGIGVNSLCGPWEGEPGTGVRIMDLDFRNTTGDASYSDAIIYAVDNGADVFSLSYQAIGSFTSLYSAIEYARDYGGTNVDGMIVFIAAGNDHELQTAECLDVNNYATNFELNNFAYVGGYGWDGLNAYNWGTCVRHYQHDTYRSTSYDAINGYGYSNSNGTSAATPVNAAVAALLVSYAYHNDTIFTADEILNIMDIGSINIRQYQTDPNLDDPVEFNGVAPNAYLSIKEMYARIHRSKGITKP